MIGTNPFFKKMKDETCAVDISPAYFMDKDAIDLIRKYGADVRVILGVRRPTDWIYSMYGHYGDMFIVPDFRRFIDGCTLRREGKDYDLEFRNQKIKNTIERYQETFKDNLFIYDFSLLELNPLFLLNELEKFMGLPLHFSVENIISKKVHARGSDSGKSITRVLNTIPGLSTLLSRILPTSVLIAVRRRFEVNSGKSPNLSPRKTVDMFLTDEDRKYAASILNEDEAYYLRLFTNGPILQGRG